MHSKMFNRLLNETDGNGGDLGGGEAGGEPVDGSEGDIYSHDGSQSTETSHTGDSGGEAAGQTSHTGTPEDDERRGQTEDDAAAEGGERRGSAADKTGLGDAIAKGAKRASSGEDEDRRIAKIVAETAKTFTRSSQDTQQQQPKLSAEEIDRLLNPVRVDANTLKAFGINDATPEQIAGAQAFANSIVKNATSIANLVIEQRMRQTLTPYEPMVQFIQQQQTKQHIDAFYSRHTGLQKYEKLVQVAAKQVSPVKQDGSEKTPIEVFDEVADVVKSILQQSGITIENSGQATQRAASSGRSVPRMAALQGAGRSAGGSSSGGANNPDADIYTD